MSQVTLRLPNSLHKKAKEIAKKDDISLNMMITLALAEKLSVLESLSSLEQRAQQGEGLSFSDAFDQVPDVEPESFDRL